MISTILNVFYLYTQHGTQFCKLKYPNNEPIQLRTKKNTSTKYQKIKTQHQNCCQLQQWADRPVFRFGNIETNKRAANQKPALFIHFKEPAVTTSLFVNDPSLDGSWTYNGQMDVAAVDSSHLAVLLRGDCNFGRLPSTPLTGSVSAVFSISSLPKHVKISFWRLSRSETYRELWACRFALHGRGEKKVVVISLRSAGRASYCCFIALVLFNDSFVSNLFLQ